MCGVGRETRSEEKTYKDHLKGWLENPSINAAKVGL
jgi:hypothetical protein